MSAQACCTRGRPGATEILNEQTTPRNWPVRTVAVLARSIAKQLAGANLIRWEKIQRRLDAHRSDLVSRASGLITQSERLLDQISGPTAWSPFDRQKMGTSRVFRSWPFQFPLCYRHVSTPAASVMLAFPAVTLVILRWPSARSAGEANHDRRAGGNMGAGRRRLVARDSAAYRV